MRMPKSLADSLLEPLGDAKQFYKHVTTPSILAIVLLIVVATRFLVGVSFLPLLLEFCLLLIFIILYNFLALDAGKHYSCKNVLFQKIPCIIFLGIYGLAIGNNLLWAFALPSTACILSIILVPLRVRQSLALTIIFSVLVLFFWSVFDLVFFPNFNHKKLVLILPQSAILILFLKSLIYHLLKRKYFDSSFVAPQVSPELLNLSQVDFEKSNLDKTQTQTDKDLFNAASRVLAGEVISDMAWRLPVICLLVGGFTLFDAYLFNFKDRVFGTFWLTISLFQIVLLFRLFKQRELKDIYLFSFFIMLSTCAWLSLLVTFQLGPQILSVVVVFAFIFISCSFSWPRKLNLSLAGFFAICLVFLTVFLELGFLALIPSFLIIAIFLRFAFSSHLDTIMRISTPVLVRACETFTLAVSTVRLLAWHMLVVTDSKQALLLLGSEVSEIVSESSAKNSTVNNIFVRGLTKVLEESKLDSGIIRTGDLGAQFVPAIVDWLDYYPYELFFCRLSAVIDEREVLVYIVLPLSRIDSFLGRKKIFNSLSSLASIVRMNFSATRGRFISSDAILEAETSLAQRDYEINEIIHTVNNVAQDIAINCESLKEGATNSEQYLKRIDASIRYLSFGVSDVKWLRELSAVKSFPALEEQESVEVNLFLDEIKSFAEYLSERKNFKFKFINNLSRDLAVKVASREYLEAAVRLLLRMACSRLADKREIILQASLQVSSHDKQDKHGKQDMNDKNDKLVCFEVFDTGLAFDLESAKKLFASDRYERISGNLLEVSLKGVFNLAKASSGRFEFLAGQDVYTNCMLLACRAAVISQPAKRVGLLSQNSANWVLLVDDQAEVTTFYARVAQALNLASATAVSVEQALALVAQKGKPQLVITDIQLGSSSGLDLVRQLRQQFGGDLPIIVVSGRNDDAVKDEVKSVGATKYLTKPVGRRKLFNEINQLIGHV